MNSSHREELTSKLITLIEQGSAPWQKEWSSVNAAPYNPTTEKAYRGGNSLWLQIQGYQDPRWATFNQAKEQGWHIKSGSKGTKIEYWITNREVPIKDENGKPILDEQGNAKIELLRLDVPMVKTFTVFNCEQMENVPKLEIAASYSWKPEEKAESILSESGAKILHKLGEKPHYSISNDSINLPLKEQFANSTAYYSTALHELGHWTGHEARLSRDLKNTFDTEPYAKEELRAELASYFLASKIGIPNKPENNASYIASWVKILKNDHNEIWRASRDAEKITQYLTDKEFRKSIDNAKPLLEKTTSSDNKKELALTDIRLMVDIKDKESAKQLGAKWEKDLKTWYAPKGSDLSDFKMFMGEKVVALKDTKLFIPFESKSSAKDIGAWWNKDRKQWEVKAGEDVKNIPEKYFKEPLKAAKDEITFKEFAASKGLIIDDLQADGLLHRVPIVEAKAGAKDGAYVYFDDEKGRVGWLQNHKTGEIATHGNLSERSEFIKGEIDKDMLKRRAIQDKEHLEVAKKAEYLINKEFTKAETHAYLDKKGVKPHGTYIDKNGALIIPLKDIDGNIKTFQSIQDDGSKYFIRGGEKSGNFFSFGEIKDKVIICEGFATGASIYESTRVPTVAAMDASNLEKVAVVINAKYAGKVDITIAADNDHHAKDNPGLKFGEMAARAVGGALVVPRFNEVEKTQKLTDFNDLAKSRDLNAVKEQIYEQNHQIATKEREIER